MNNLKKAMVAAVELGITYPTMIAYKRAGMPCHKQGSRLFFIVDECREWIAKRKENKKHTRAWLKGDDFHKGDIVQHNGAFYLFISLSHNGRNALIKSPNGDFEIYVRRENITLYARKVKGGEA